jgi:hypothetical protein
LHDLRVRASSSFSAGFTLAMASSLGFGSPALSKNGLLTLAFTVPPWQNHLDKESAETRWLVLQKARRHHPTLSTS